MSRIANYISGDNMENNNLVDRDYGIDILKIVSCFAVVGLHTFSREGEMASRIFLLLCGFAVPSFFMANGYLVLRNISRIKMLKKAGHYILICFEWNIIMSILYFFKGELGNPVIDTLKELLFQKGGVRAILVFGDFDYNIPISGNRR